MLLVSVIKSPKFKAIFEILRKLLGVNSCKLIKTLLVVKNTRMARENEKINQKNARQTWNLSNLSSVSRAKGWYTR